MSSANYFGLTNPQKRIWVTELVNNHVDMSNIGYLVEFNGIYDLNRLAAAVKFVVLSNDSLQFRFRYSNEIDRELVQYKPEDPEIDIRIIESETEEELFQKIESVHLEQFPVNSKYFCTFVVFSINRSRFGLFEKANHLVADGVSATIVAREVIETYRKLEANQFTPGSIKPSYIDFIKEENQYLGSDKYIKSKEFWTNKFSNFGGEEITFVLNKDKKNSLKVARRSFQIPPGLIPLVDEFKTSHKLSNFALFMALLAVYFNRFMNHTDIVIGMPVSNRSNKVFKEMTGMFVSTIPFRIKMEENWGFLQLVSHIKAELYESLRHQSYPYNHLVKDLKEMDIDSSNFLNVQLIELPGMHHEAVQKRIFYSTRYNISQLSVYLNQQNNNTLEELDIAIDYHADLFQEREIDVLFKRLTVILEQAIKEPEIPVSELLLLDADEYKRTIYDLNKTEMPFPSDKTIPELFEEQASKNPGNIALEYDGISITYEKLRQLTDKLASRLQKTGVTTDSIVGILCERSIEAVVSILSILKAGGAYLPIDPEYPTDRKNYIIENSGIKTLLVEKILEDREQPILSESHLNTVIVDYNSLENEPEVNGFIRTPVSGENLIYVIYTSGTTGNPKGTLLRHRNALNYIWWGAGFYVGGQPMTFPLFSSLSFDLTVTSIFIPLITGNTLIIYRDSEKGLLIEKVIADNKVDIIKLTPSHLKIVSQGKCDTSRIKSFIVGGEDLKTDLCKELDDHFKGKLNIYNEYGPTETTVGCMIHRYDKNTDTGLSVPIGKPSGNVAIYILDKNKKPLPQGIIGEIYISGEGVAAGYLKNETLTSERFVDNPFIPGKKMYKSGDLGRWNLDNILEYFGRADEQVKIRGYRIEPGEVEKHVKRLPGVKDGVIYVRKDPQPELCAFMVPQDQIKELEVAALREALSRELPSYMIPSEFIQVDHIPLTRNGKVDFRKLDTMGKRLESSREYVAPRTEMETLLAEVWSGVLNERQIGVTDNFFELGGDSIKAVQIAARLNDAGKTVNVKEILTHQTIAQLCINVDFESHIRKYDQGPIEGELGITPIASWFLHHEFENPDHFNQSVLIEFKRKPQISLLEKTFEIIINQHDALRLNYNAQKKTFFFNNGYLNRSFKINTIDLSIFDETQKITEIKNKGYEIKGSFDISNTLLIRAVFFSENEKPGKLLITAHHLVIDGISWRILLEDLLNIYSAFEKGENPRLSKKTASYADWFDALSMYRDSGKLTNEKEYWNLPSIECQIPYTTQTDDWKMANREISITGLNADNTAYLLTQAHETYKTDAQILVCAALVRTLREFTGKSDVEFEIENHGRHIDNIDVSRTMGWFTAIYPLRIQKEDRSIGDEIKTVKEALRKVPNNGIGYGILKYMSPGVEFPQKSMVGIRFNYLGQFDREVENQLFSLSSLQSGSDIDLNNSITAAIEINAMVLNGVFQVEILYNKKAYSKETIELFRDKYVKNLEEILNHIRNENDVHFTPSDFNTVDMDEDDLAALFE